MRGGAWIYGADLLGVSDAALCWASQPRALERSAAAADGGGMQAMIPARCDVVLRLLALRRACSPGVGLEAHVQPRHGKAPPSSLREARCMKVMRA